MQYFNILLPEANIAICMVCQRRILRYCIPRLQYIVILEASLFNILSQGGTKFFLLLAKKGVETSWNSLLAISGKQISMYSGCIVIYRDILSRYTKYCRDIQNIVAIYNILLQYTIYCNILAIYCEILKYAIYCDMRNAHIAIIAIYENSILQYILSS